MWNWKYKKLKTNRRYFTNITGLNDILFLLLFGFLFMLILTLRPIPETKKKAEIKRKAEFIIILEWESKSNADIDLWVKGPKGETIFFRNRESGIMHLDRDDLGHSSDTISGQNNTKTLDINREIVTIRGTIPGWYIVNVHYYKKAGDTSLKTTVDIMKINPYSLVERKVYNLEFQGEEHTASRFRLDKDGNVVEKDNLQISLFPKSLVSAGPF